MWMVVDSYSQPFFVSKECVELSAPAYPEGCEEYNQHNQSAVSPEQYAASYKQECCLVVLQCNQDGIR